MIDVSPRTQQIPELTRFDQAVLRWFVEESNESNATSSERKTGVIRAAGPSTCVRVRDGGLDLLRHAA